MQRILITGGAGRVAALLRPRLARTGRTLRLLDRTPAPAVEGTGQEEVILGCATDPGVLHAACHGVNAIVHLAGQRLESDINDIIESNIMTAYRVLDAAHTTGVPRVILASSNHAAGFHQHQIRPIPADVPGRPDTLYGWSKTAIETLGRLYHDRFHIHVICIRIGCFRQRPPNRRALAIWLSPDDGARLIEACLAAPSPGYRIVWGISRNTRRWLSLDDSTALGYRPQDDAERFAADLTETPSDTGDDLNADRIGGHWCDIPLGITPPVPARSTPHPTR